MLYVRIPAILPIKTMCRRQFCFEYLSRVMNGCYFGRTKQKQLASFHMEIEIQLEILYE